MFEIKLIFYGLSSMLQFSQFVWPLSYTVWDVFNKFLLIDATDKSKRVAIKSAFLSHEAYTPFHFSRTLTLKLHKSPVRNLKFNIFFFHLLKSERDSLNLKSACKYYFYYRINLTPYPLTLSCYFSIYTVQNQCSVLIFIYQLLFCTTIAVMFILCLIIFTLCLIMLIPQQLPVYCFKNTISNFFFYFLYFAYLKLAFMYVCMYVYSFTLITRKLWSRKTTFVLEFWLLILSLLRFLRISIR